MGLDVGDARIGVALADPSDTLATPLNIIRRDAGQPARRVAELVRQHGVTVIVVGLPDNPGGGNSLQEIKTRNFAHRLAAELKKLTGSPAQPAASAPPPAVE